jgi:hypothetical protein
MHVFSYEVDPLAEPPFVQQHRRLVKEGLNVTCQEQLLQPCGTRIENHADYSSTGAA